MKLVFVALLGFLVLAGCASQPRTLAPAPVESSRSRSPSAQPEAIPEPPAEQAVEVYAYRPPSGAPDAQPTETLPVDDSGSVGTMAALPSETASPVPPAGTAPAPAVVQPVVPGTPVASEGVAPAPAPEVVAYSAPPPPKPALPPAAGALEGQAEQQRQRGDYVGAAATLERALRIQPQEAYLWNRLARVRMEQGRYAQAGNFARRSNALAKDQPQVKQDNWSMIAVSRRTAGDTAGAMEAEEKARGG